MFKHLFSRRKPKCGPPPPPPAEPDCTGIDTLIATLEADEGTFCAAYLEGSASVCAEFDESCGCVAIMDDFFAGNNNAGFFGDNC